MRHELVRPVDLGPDLSRQVDCLDGSEHAVGTGEARTTRHPSPEERRRRRRAHDGRDQEPADPQSEPSPKVERWRMPSATLVTGVSFRTGLPA